jgi:hypothetical protein
LIDSPQGPEADVLGLVVSLEDVAAELELAASDVAIEQQLPSQPAARAVEAIATLTDDLFLGAEPSLTPTLGAGIEAGEEIAVISEQGFRYRNLSRRDR